MAKRALAPHFFRKVCGPTFCRRAPASGSPPRHAGSGRSTAASAPALEPRGRRRSWGGEAGITARARARARTRSASSAPSNPAGEEGIAATSQLGGFQGAGPPGRLPCSPPARARARPRPHVSLRPRGMWVTEPSGLTCPRPPPPPQRPLCNAASRALPANRRPRGAERKHSAHVARAARPCEGGARPAPPGRAAAMRGTVRVTAGRPAGRREPSPGRVRSARQPTPPPWGHPWPPPPQVPQVGCERPLRRPRPAAVRLLPAFTSMVPSGRGPRPPASRGGGSSASCSAPRRPGLEAAVVAGPPHGRGAGPGGRRAGCRERGGGGGGRERRSSRGP